MKLQRLGRNISEVEVQDISKHGIWLYKKYGKGVRVIYSTMMDYTDTRGMIERRKKIMSLMRPISDLRNKFREISTLCHRNKEPIFITNRGRGDLVVMSHETYEQQVALMALYQKLGEAEAEERRGEMGLSHEGVIKRLRQRGKARY